MNYDNIKGKSIDLSKIKEYKDYERVKDRFKNFDTIDSIRLIEYVEHPERFADFTIRERVVLRNKAKLYLSPDQREGFEGSIEGKRLQKLLIKEPESKKDPEFPFAIAMLFFVILINSILVGVLSGDFLISVLGLVLCPSMAFGIISLWSKSAAALSMDLGGEIENNILDEDRDSAEDPAETLEKWRQVNSDYDDVLKRMSSYELDPELAFQYPAFNDIGVPEVAGMTRKLRAVKRVVSDADRQQVDKVIAGESSASSLKSGTVLEDYRAAVDELHVAFQTAEHVAKKVRDGGMTVENQKLLGTALWLIRHAKDPANSDELRATYYQQLKRTVRKLNAEERIVPVDVTEQIEHQARLTLERAPEDNSADTESTGVTAEDLIQCREEESAKADFR